MPKATVTVRELRNKDTGIDLSVTSYREIPGLVRSTFEYQIVVVSSLSCFKLPSHKDTDVVQFTLFKKFAEFEDLRAKLNESYSGTAFPPLLKKSIIVSEAVIKERRNSLDLFVKFLSSTPRIITSSPVLTFLGVDAQKAKRFASGDADEQKPQEKTEGNDDDKETEQEEKSASNLFEEEEEDEEDFLTAGKTGAVDEDGDEDFFSSADTGTQNSSQNNTCLFESQDLKRELTEEDETDFSFVPDAIITKREVVKVSEYTAEDEENDELLNVDEDIDFDKLLTLTTDSKTQQQSVPAQPQEKPKPSPAARPQVPQKPSIPTKPTPKPKPTTMDKPSPKPSLPSKPKPRSPKPAATADGSTAASKSAPPERPKPAPRKLKPHATEKKPEGKAETSETWSSNAATAGDMGTDDIMQYIAANAEGEDADLDLFS